VVEETGQRLNRSPRTRLHLSHLSVTGKKSIFIPHNPDFSPNWEAIEKALDSGLDALLTTNPNNPSGYVWKRAELERLVSLTEKYGCLLILDEVYFEMIWVEEDGVERFSPFFTGELRPNVICIRGFSKAIGLQSWRLGYLISHPNTINQLMVIHDPIYICVPWYQHALADFLNFEFDDFRAHIASVNSLMRSNWKTLSLAIEKSLGWTPIPPKGSMYGCFRHTEDSDREAVLKALKKGVGVCPGTIFYEPGRTNTGIIRIHCGVDKSKTDEIIQNLTRSLTSA